MTKDELIRQLHPLAVACLVDTSGGVVQLTGVVLAALLGGLTEDSSALMELVHAAGHIVERVQ